MSPTETIYEKWTRDSALSWSERAWKARQYVTSATMAPLWTRSVDRRGRGTRCIGRPLIVNFGTMDLGDDVVLRSRPVAVELATSRGGILTIGAVTTINAGTSIHADRLVRIGERVRIGAYVNVMDTHFHAVSVDRSRPEAAPIEIEDDVWLGVKSTVLPGVRIGCGAVVAANAVVNRDVPPGVIVAGVPARVVGEVPDASPTDGARPRPVLMGASA